jgi:UDP-N-acetylmuramoyl-tripeptide--D-alanyl-D-alanine ligase
MIGGQMRGIAAKFRNALLYGVALLWRRTWRRRKLIAITGSTGKTTAKECLVAILSRHFEVLHTQGNFNNRWEQARILLRAQPRHLFAVMEVAVVRPGMMWTSALLLRPDVVVMLAINWQHGVNFRSLDEIAVEKAKLLGGLRRNGVAILNGEDPRVLAMSPDARYRKITFGLSRKHDLWADQISATWPEKLEFRLHEYERSFSVRTNFVGTHWTTSVLAAITAARECGVRIEDSITALRRVQPFEARMQPVKLPRGAVLLRDEYNGSMTTLLIALRVLREARVQRRVAVIGNISDSLEAEPERSERVGREVATSADVAIFVGGFWRRSREGARAAGMADGNVFGFESLQEAGAFLGREFGKGDLILLKGGYEDHLSRIYFQQTGTVRCWIKKCNKDILCDECSDLGWKQLPLPTSETGS